MNVNSVNKSSVDYKNTFISQPKQAVKNSPAETYSQGNERSRFDSFSNEEHIQKFKSYYSDLKEKSRASAYCSPQNTETSAAGQARYTGRATYILGDGTEKNHLKELPPEISALRQLTARAGGYTVCRSSGDGGFSYAIKTGSKSVITIDSRFLESIANDPELIKHYANEIENMRRIDKCFERQAKRAGKTIVSRGWHIDKDGGISSWSVVKTERKAKKGYLEQLNEYRQKINKKKKQKQKEQQKLDERRSKQKEELLRLEGRKKAAMKEKLKRKAKKAKLYEFNELTIKRSPKTYKSISISSGYTPPIADLNKLNGFYSQNRNGFITVPLK